MHIGVEILTSCFSWGGGVANRNAEMFIVIVGAATTARPQPDVLVYHVLLITLNLFRTKQLLQQYCILYLIICLIFRQITLFLAIMQEMSHRNMQHRAWLSNSNHLLQLKLF